MTPFFSVIIPTYNPGDFLSRMLESITHNQCADQIEVIISDDCSTENIYKTVNDFKDKLYIRTICNDKHAGFPRNGRQHGAEVEEGKWFCFADQDDYFKDGGFDRIYEYIEANNPENYIITDFIEHKVDTGEEIIRQRGKGWTHGKFFEKGFWQKYDISYDEVQYCEDINLTTKMDCVMDLNGITPYMCEEIIYVWCRRNDSLADIDYFRKSMGDYVRGTLGVLIQFVEKTKDFENKEMYDVFCVKFLATLLHVYFYFQSTVLSSRELLLRTMLIVQPIFTKFKELTGVSSDFIVNSFIDDFNMMELYQYTRNEDYSQIPFVERMSFKEWLNNYLD